ADRMLLPAGRLHDRGDRYTLGLFEQREDGRLLGLAAGRTRGSFLTLAKPLCETLGMGIGTLVGAFAVRHFRIPFGLRRPSGAVTTEAPQWRHRQRGGDPDRARRPYQHDVTDAPFAAEVQSFL